MILNCCRQNIPKILKNINKNLFIFRFLHHHFLIKSISFNVILVKDKALDMVGVSSSSLLTSTKFLNYK